MLWWLLFLLLNNSHLINKLEENPFAYIRISEARTFNSNTINNNITNTIKPTTNCCSITLSVFAVFEGRNSYWEFIIPWNFDVDHLQTDRQLRGQMDRVRKCHRGKRKWFTIVVNTHNEVEMREQKKSGNGLSEFGHILYLCWLSVNVVMMTGLVLI